MRSMVFAVALLVIGLVPHAVVAQGLQRMLYIAHTDDGFDGYLAAAMQKKKVPVSIVTKQEMADLTLNATPVKLKQESTGSKVARCLFAYCAGAEDKGSVSVQLVDKGGVVQWSYAVNKERGGAKNMQSMAEAVAKHLKSEYFHQ